MNKRILLFMIVSVMSSTGSWAQDIKNQLIDELLHVTNAKGAVTEIANSIVDVIKQEKPYLSNEDLSKMTSEIDYNSFLTSMKDIYYQTYSQNELKALLDSVKTSDRKTYQELSMKSQKQLYNLSMQFGRQIMNEVKKKIKN